jgi:hypothetical protein
LCRWRNQAGDFFGLARADADAGRVFVSVPGHFTWTFDDSLCRILILRGLM